ncbi:5'-methylthioadenosine/adenosylhomocysteine nucleosidase [Thiomonas sp. FB-6]|uniref:5'-methylthioadenosine/adenosylhomocysteine nucleosidase n=1 Tax=Thiomonas sp. FB-6 TaxID=1158291 RepID=UPI00037B7843|nr:5'-methylthioadenosine/adenosylhomocysteine nucleosidase [Thiomonas sp. FB-6]
MPDRRNPRIGVLSALQAEQQLLLQQLLAVRPLQLRGQRSFHRGRLWGFEAVLVLSGVGKVAAATSATSLIAEFGCEALLFTGTAGGLGEGVGIGDVVVAEQCLQHDLDASPLFPRFEVPLTGRSRFAADPAWTERLAEGAQRALQGMLEDDAGAARLQGLGITAPRLHRGLLLSGDRFIAGPTQAAELRQLLPDALAVDMETAAVAQVCADYRVPFAAVRCISDRADASAHIDFDRFTTLMARHYGAAVLRLALRGF